MSTGKYLNFSGCGNTFSSDHPVVRNYVIDCLRNWVAEGGVDGFRFDLASVLGRDRHGNVLVEPPVVKRISEDSLLRDTKLIAEPWDAAGLYQVGTFPGRGPLVGLERPLSRRRPALLAGRSGHDFGAGHADLRQRRSLPGPRAARTRSTSSAATTGSR